MERGSIREAEKSVSSLFHVFFLGLCFLMCKMRDTGGMISEHPPSPDNVILVVFGVLFAKLLVSATRFNVAHKTPV